MADFYLRKKHPNKAILMQISTGEGKSTIIAIKAAIWALCGERVDIVTSNSLLAKRDAEDRQSFFKMLSMTIDHNGHSHKEEEKQKAAYKCDIIYGGPRDFLSHFVLDSFHNKVS